MNAGLQRRGPTGSIYTRTLVLGAFDGLPIDQERDRVLSLRNTIVRLARRYTCGSAGDDTGWDGLSIEDPTANINMMGR